MFCFLSVPFYPVQEWFSQNEFLFDFWALMCQFSFCYWILSDPEAGSSWINIAANHSCLSESYWGWNWKFLNSVVLELRYFLSMAKSPSLPPGSSAFPILWPAAGLQPQAKSWVEPVHSTCEMWGMQWQEGVLAEIRNRPSSSTFALQQSCWCSSCWKVKLSYHTWRKILTQATQPLFPGFSGYCFLPLYCTAPRRCWNNNVQISVLKLTTHINN